MKQLVERVNGVDNDAKAIDLRRMAIADGVAERYENTLRDISQRLYALEEDGTQRETTAAPPSATAGLRYWFASY